MNTLIINGSPRKNGDTAFLINELQNKLESNIKIIDTYSTSISPCIDCRYCWKNENCAIDDDMKTVFADIDNADNIVIASPIYFSELTGSLLNFASRLQYLWVSKNIRNTQILSSKPRYGFVILVGGGDGNPAVALSTAKCLITHMGAIFKDAVISHKTNSIPAKEDAVAVQKIRKIANLINYEYLIDLTIL